MEHDKDTFIAENIFPKNDQPLKRKPRLNVKSVDISSATRKTKLTLCVLGSWAIYMPPYNLARLSAITREAGYFTRVFDFNVQSYYDLKEANPELTHAWKGANYYWWQDPEYYTRIHPTYKPILDSYVKLILKDKPDIVGFSTYYTNILPTRYVISEIRKKNPELTIIMGGPECHEQYFKKPEEVDYYFIGESEQNFIDFLNDWENNIKPKTDSIGSLYSDTRIDIDSLPYPDYSDFDLMKYWGQNSICAEISRGCIAKCSYCTEVYYWKFRDRGSQTVVDELEYQVKKYNIKFVSFVDSLMNGNLKEFRKFCEELIKRKLNITWWGYARADGRMDIDFYRTMAAAGCQGFNYGIESGSDKVLQAINKKNTVAEINQNLIDSEKVGMRVSACWVIGAPGEDIEAFNHSFNLIWNHRSRLMAVSPGPGLGDNYGSAYDDREKFNINPRHLPWLGGWYTMDYKNTKLHRFIRIKLMHIWLYLCREYGGEVQNVHSVGEITDHFTVKFDSEYLKTEVPYENFDFNIIQSGLGDFADSLMNEVFALFRLLWRVRGGYEMTIKFNDELDHKDFIFAIVPDTHKFIANCWFKIDDRGNYQTKFDFVFRNTYKEFVNIDDFEYTYETTGKWKESVQHKTKKILWIKSSGSEQETEVKGSISLPIENAFANMAVDDRQFLHRVSRFLPANSIIVEAGSRLGGATCIIAAANRMAKIYAIDKFIDYDIKWNFDTVNSWAEGQLRDWCLAYNKPISLATELLSKFRESFDKDPSGVSTFKELTKKYSNITLVDGNDTNYRNLFNFKIDMYVDNTNLKNPFLKENLEFWSKKIKTNGYILVNPYIENQECDVFHEANRLAENKFKLIDKSKYSVLLQKTKKT